MRWFLALISRMLRESVVQNWILKLDDALIDKVFQRLVDLISQYATINCFQIARFCTDLCALAWILSNLEDVVTLPKLETAGFVAFQFAMLVLVLGAIMVLRQLFDRSGNAKGMQANPLRPAMFIHRLISLVFLVNLSVKAILGSPDFTALAQLAMQVFLTMAVYTGACLTRPPKRQAFLFGTWSPISAGSN